MNNLKNNQKPKKKNSFSVFSPKKNKKNKTPKMFNFLSNFISIILVFLIISSLYGGYIESKSQNSNEISISTLVSDIKAGNVKNIDIKGDKLEIFYTDDSEKFAKKEVATALSTTLSNYGLNSNEIDRVDINVKNPTGFSYWLGTLAPFLFPILLLILIVYFMSRQLKGAGMQALSFGESKAKFIDPKDNKQKVTFKDVAGAKEAKEELVEVVDFLKNPKKFLDIGATIPKGLLLMGSPGTGKTLLAKAIAGEAGVPFFSISGSEFVEMFVGVGASRVRDLFKMAKKMSPAIIFIDEIDSVGRVRGVGMGGGNDEREQTLNQILVEMDGFDTNEKVIVIAATNRPDVLDPALLRPGRFDRRVMVDLPDREDREKILEIHGEKKPYAEDVNLKVIAERTPGFSGADLHSLMNEGAILAARENRTKVSQFDLIRSIEKVMLGPERKSHVMNKKEKERTAYHEIGHAIIASVLEHSDPVHKVSIIARGRAGGYTLKLPFEDKRLQTKKEFLDDLAVSLGGYVAEEIVYDDVTTGPSNDLQVSTSLARDMVTKYGMSDKIGALALESSGGKPIYGGRNSDGEMSEKMSSIVDEEVSKIMKEAKERAQKVLSDYKDAFENITKRLIEVETIEREEFEQLLLANGIVPKKKEDFV